MLVYLGFRKRLELCENVQSYGFCYNFPKVYSMLLNKEHMFLTNSEHPYLFFNQDHVSVSFLGFIVNSNGDLLDKLNRNVIERRIMSKQLLEGLKLNGVDLSSSFDNWSRSVCSSSIIRMSIKIRRTTELVNTRSHYNKSIRLTEDDEKCPVNRKN